MSRKNNKRPSLPGDTYYTPAWVVQQCVEHVLPVVCDEEPLAILEPSAGTGAFVRAMRQTYPDALIDAVDNDSTLPDWPEASSSYHGDFLSWSPVMTDEQRPYDLAIGNPPYTLAMPFIQRVSGFCQRLVFLLRQGFMSSSRRNDFFRATPPADIFILPHRPSFTSDNHTDQTDYCLMCWDFTKPTLTTNVYWLPKVPLEVRRGRAD